MKNPNITLKADGKLYCADIPDPKYSPEGYMMEDHDAAKAEAIANALPVINPQDVWSMCVFVTIDNKVIRIELKVGELYPWNGGAEKENRMINDSKGNVIDTEWVVRLSLPDNKQNLKGWSREEVKILRGDFENSGKSEPTQYPFKAEADKLWKEVRKENPKGFVADTETQEQLWEEAEKIFNQHALHHLAWKSLQRNFTLTRR